MFGYLDFLFLSYSGRIGRTTFWLSLLVLALIEWGIIWLLMMATRDVWTTLTGMFVRINGVTVGPLSGPAAASFTASSPLVVTFPGGTSVNYALQGATGSIVAGSGGTGSSFTPTPVLGVAGSVVGSIGFQNATSGTETVQPATGALGSGIATLPAGTYNLVGDSLTQTLTSKTYSSGTLSGTFSGNATFSGNETFSGQAIHTGTSGPASAGGQTVIMGTIAVPTLTNTGQGNVFNTVAGGLILQGDGSSDDVRIYNKSAALIMNVPTGTTVPQLPGLAVGTCAAGLGLDSSNNIIKDACPGSATTITVGSTLVASGTTNNILFNNAGTLGNETIASILTAGTGITITGTTNATIAVTNPVTATGPQVCDIVSTSATTCNNGGSAANNGTYTVPAGSKWLEIRVVGGGGGGGAQATNAGGSGGNSTFSTLTGNGGAGGIAAAGSGGQGGSATGGDTNIPGGAGGPGFSNAATSLAPSGGQGGSSCLSGGGNGGNVNNAGTAAPQNSGAGGGGAGASSGTGSNAGGGGGAGGCVRAIFQTPGATYSYAIGAAGTAGAAGTLAGGAGATGHIIVIAHFNY